MRIKALTIITSVMFQLSGCAVITDYQPVVDSYSDPNAQFIERDLAECKVLAKQAAGSPLTKGAIGAAIGGLAGAAGGAAIGAATGNNAGKGAAIGAAALGIGGAAQQGYTADDKFRSAYNYCMNGRGHNVIR